MEKGEEGGLGTVDHCGKVYSAYKACLTHQMWNERQSPPIRFFLDFIRVFFGYGFKEHLEPGAGRVCSGQRGLCHQVRRQAAGLRHFSVASAAEKLRQVACSFQPFHPNPLRM